MNRLKVWLLNKTMKSLYNTINEEDILIEMHGKMFAGGKMLTDGDRRSIISGAQSIQNIETWKQMIKDMKYAANKKLFAESVIIDDMIFAKAMLYTIDVMELKLNKLSKRK